MRFLDKLKKPLIVIPVRRSDVITRKAGIEVRISTLTLIMVVVVIAGLGYLSRYLKGI